MAELLPPPTGGTSLAEGGFPKGFPFEGKALKCPILTFLLSGMFLNMGTYL
jgi:hypothetical protein